MRPAKHTRVPNHSFARSLLGARLDSYYEETQGERHDVVVNYHALELSEPAEMVWEDGRVVERVKGVYVPRRLRFKGVTSLCCEGPFAQMKTLPPDHGARSLRGVLSFSPFNSADLMSIFTHGSDEPARFWLYYKQCQAEECSGEAEPFEQVRDWSPPPPLRPGLIPMPKKLRQRFGGDPVYVQLGGQLLKRRLFVGDLDSQREQRPQVDAVLNVGERSSRWVKEGPVLPSDRWVVHGEGSAGMNAAQITAEAEWVIERLQAGKRVLVHCVAGLNRSTTIACAVLILLEGLSAEAALDRVRDHHAWARPDENHWLVLKWIAKK